MIESLKQPPAPEAEPPDEEYACERCPLVFTGHDAEYELGAHEVEHLEDC